MNAATRASTAEPRSVITPEDIEQVSIRQFVLDVASPSNIAHECDGLRITM
jgi:glutamyl-tRNA reductase